MNIPSYRQSYNLVQDEFNGVLEPSASQNTVFKYKLYRQKYLWLWGSAVWLMVGCFFLPFANVSGQIIPDNTLGDERSSVTPQGINRDRIDGGAIRDTNLFHSFEKFSIGTGRDAYFSNPEGIANIFSRVTGSDRSDIFGTLGVLGDANLFLINPNGILFGPDATLDVRGAFHASTANEIIFPDGNTFSALEPEGAPLLTMDVTVPVGVAFAGAGSGTLVGSLINEATLDVDSGQTLTLQGNTVMSRGELVAPEGGVQLLGHQVKLTNQAQVDVGHLDIEATEKISIASQEQIVVSENLNISTTDPEGVINLRGVDFGVLGDISLSGNAVSLRDSDILSLGNLDINSNLLRIRGSDLTILGDIRFENDELRVIRDSDLFVLGSLTVQNNNLLMRDSQFIALDIGDSLEDGGILENVGELLDQVGFFLGDRESAIRDTFNTNNRSRDIVISTRNSQLFDNGQILVGTLAGQGRSIQLIADDLDISNSSRIIMFSAEDSQQGHLSINADQIRLLGIEDDDDPTEAIPNTIGVFNFDNSTSGTIDIVANDLLMTDSSLVITSTLGRREGGNIDVDVDTLRINGSGGNPLFSSFLAAVAIGEENDSNGFPSGGDLTVNANEILLEEGSEITTTTVSSPGGQILVEADEIVITGRRETFRGFTSSSIASESYGQGDGGVVIVRADSIAIEDSGDIATSNRRPDEPLLEGDNSELNADRIITFGQLFSGVDEELQARIPSTDFVRDGIGLFVGQAVLQLIPDEDLEFNLQDFIPNIGEIFEDRVSNEIEIDQSGDAGDIFVFADNLSVKDGSEIFARTRAIGDGGNIDITVGDFLLLEGSNIGTTAGTDGAGGDGGDITIRADNGFIVGVREGNGNISANAFTGDGGNVRITAQDIFGLRFRDDSTVLSDITASSTFGQDGEVLIDTLNVDVARGLEPLPDQPVAPDINDTCSARASEGAIAFFELGQGGSPPNPDSMVESNGAIAPPNGESDWLPLIGIAPRPSPQAHANTSDRPRSTGIFGPSCQSPHSSLLPLQPATEEDRH